MAYWGNFEALLDIFLAALIEGESADGRVRNVKNWKRRSYKQRRELFVAICHEWVATWKPESADQLAQLVESSVALHAKRNLIAHGNYSYTIPPRTSVATECYAVNHTTGEKMYFDSDVLKALYHAISHLTTDLMTAFRAVAQIEGPFHAVSDDEILRIYRDSVHPWNPDPSKRPSTP